MKFSSSFVSGSLDMLNVVFERDWGLALPPPPFILNNG